MNRIQHLEAQIADLHREEGILQDCDTRRKTEVDKELYYLNIELEKERSKVLTCVYCGKEYPMGVPSFELQEHIKSCSKHPLSKALADNRYLKGLLEAMIRAFTNIRDGDPVTEEAIKLQFVTRRQTETLLEAYKAAYDC